MTLLVASILVAVMLRAQMVRILSALEADEERADSVRASVEGRLIAVLNQEVGLRGFLATGDPSFLEPYDSGRRDEARLRTKLVLGALPAEDRDELQPALLLEERAARRWQSEIAQPQIALRRSTALIDLPALMVVGKLRFDDYRAAHGTLRQALKRAFVNCERRRRAQLSRANLVAGGVAVRVVDALEVIDVDHERRQRRATAARQAQLARQPFGEEAAVVGARQAVAHRAILNRAEEPLQRLGEHAHLAQARRTHRVDGDLAALGGVGERDQRRDGAAQDGA